MIKIEIQASDADALRAQVIGLYSILAGASTPAPVEQPAPATQALLPPRRTRTAAAAKDSAPVAAPASEPAPVAPPAEPPAEPPAPAPAEPPAKPKAESPEQLRVKVRQALAKWPDVDKVVALLAEHGGKSVSSVPDDRLVDLLAAAEKGQP